MRVVIAQTVALNGGDAAILFGLLNALREAFGDVTVTIFDSQPDVARRLYPDLDFRQLLWMQARTRVGRVMTLQALRLVRSGNRAAARLLVGSGCARDLEAYADADLVVWTGGTYLVEHYDLEPRWYELDLLREITAPLVLFTQSAGPFTRPESRRRATELGKRAALVMARDVRTRGHFASSGVPPEKLHVCADGAFALDPPTAVIPRRDEVIVSVRHWPHASGADVAQRYVAAHALAVERLVREHDVGVRFVSTCQGVPEYWADDARTAAEIVGRLDEAVRRRVTIDGGFHGPGALLEVYATADVVIATRMHAAILGLIAGAVVLPVAYEFKTAELFTRFGQGDLVQELEAIEPEAFAAWAVDNYRDRDGLRAAQRAGTEVLQKEAASLSSLFESVELRR